MCVCMCVCVCGGGNKYLANAITSVVQVVLTSVISQIKAYIQNKKMAI